MLYYTMLYYAILYYAILYYTMLCYAIPYRRLEHGSAAVHDASREVSVRCWNRERDSD